MVFFRVESSPEVSRHTFRSRRSVFACSSFRSRCVCNHPLSFASLPILTASSLLSISETLKSAVRFDSVSSICALCQCCLASPRPPEAASPCSPTSSARVRGGPPLQSPRRHRPLTCRVPSVSRLISSSLSVMVDLHLHQPCTPLPSSVLTCGYPSRVCEWCTVRRRPRPWPCCNAHPSTAPSPFP